MPVYRNERLIDGVLENQYETNKYSASESKNRKCIASLKT